VKALYRVDFVGCPDVGRWYRQTMARPATVLGFEGTLS